MVNRRKDGTLYEEDSTIAPVKDVAGRIEYFVEVQRDVTQQVALEERIRQAGKMEAIGRLAGGVAHDFNNQLTVIKGYCDLLLKDLPAECPHREPLEEIARAAERSYTLTQQLLAFSRKQVLFPRVVDLNAVLKDLSRTLGRLIGERVRLRVVASASHPLVEADPGQLQQAIMNLAINARDAMPEGGSLTLETANVELDEKRVGPGSDVPAGRYVMLAVTDTGSGMDEQTSKHIFEPFFTTKETGKGTGLGLSMVHGFVKQSGGRITVYSEVGHGSTFRVYLPEHKAESNLPPAEPPSREARGKETILVVEDEEPVRKFIVRLLEDRGWRVLTASDADAALVLARDHPGPIHLLISDVVMPGMNGVELACKLREVRPETKVLYITGYAENAVLGDRLGGGECSVLTKPFSGPALSQKVREALYGYSRTAELAANQGNV
jgi:signal transduction histidine kinase/ActR/RegA family two-component response regulator